MTRFLILVAAAGQFTALGAQQSLPDSTPRRAGSPWSHVAIGAGALLVAGLADQTIRSEIQGAGGAGARATGRDISHWAPPVAIGLGLGLAGAGAATGNGSLARTGRDAVVAMGAAELAGAAIKILTGRARPDAGLGAGDFAPFQRAERDAAFPSGHTTMAFAFAAAVGRHSRSRAVRLGAYGAAGLVGAARIAADRHWTSDVVGGALLGTLAGHVVVRRLEPRGSAPQVVPLFHHRCVGIALRVRL